VFDVDDDDDDDVWRNDALSRAVHTTTLVPSRADVWTSNDGVATIDTLLGTVERHGAACVELVPPEIASDPTFRDAFADIDAAAASIPCTPLATSSSATSAVRCEREGVEFVVKRHTALDKPAAAVLPAANGKALRFADERWSPCTVPGGDWGGAAARALVAQVAATPKSAATWWQCDGDARQRLVRIDTGSRFSKQRRCML